MVKFIFDEIRFSTEIRFLTAAIKENHSAARTHFESFPGIDFHRLTETVQQNGLGGLLYSRLKKMDLLELLPDSVRTKLKDIYLGQWCRSAEKISETVRIRTLFDEDGIEVILLKGLATAQAFYGDIAERVFVDTDVLVKKKDARRCEALLKIHGFTGKGEYFPTHGLATRFALHHAAYCLPTGLLELHWKLHNFPFFRIRESTLWETRKIVTIEEEDFFRLDDEYELLLHLFSQLGEWSMRRCFDIYFVLKTMRENTDWKAFFKTRRRERTLKLCVNVLWFSLSLIDALDEFPEIKTFLDSHRAMLIPLYHLRFNERTLGFSTNNTTQAILTKLNLYASPWISGPWWLLTAHSRKKGFHG